MGLLASLLLSPHEAPTAQLDAVRANKHKRRSYNHYKLRANKAPTSCFPDFKTKSAPWLLTNPKSSTP